MEGIPGHLPSLLYAHKVQRKAASVGFDWDGVAGAWPKIAEESGRAGEACLRAPEGRRASPRSWAICSSPWSTWPATSTSTPRRRCGARPPSFGPASKASKRLAAARGLDLRALDLAGLDGLWDEVKRTE